MSVSIRIAIVFACLLLALYVIRLVSTDKLQLRYSLLWLALVVTLLLCSIFPVPIYFLSSFFGFVTSANFIFVAGFIFVILILLSLSVTVSRQALAIKNLTQKIALLEKNSSSS
ncbi:DUF2304 domain-containing protein [Collinsella sp. AF02-46-1]|uniref:DUF2304 domain-containing protein n=1 Tax=unclassified Collinsella TaxID=2637548 RepID=UPI000E4AB3E8|nr:MULTISPECIES: DUF2304 domain-containing protein [unclassified Collinsella]RGX50560.1 DUF2304 domain-containing protein [Collinsella sp. AF02-46-1]RHB79301.1 DUF2304 domain-containing protein [Collinsella sp. AM38-1BH]